MLWRAPDLNIERIEYPELQKSINMDMDARSVRLDMDVKDEKGRHIYSFENISFKSSESQDKKSEIGFDKESY